MECILFFCEGAIKVKMNQKLFLSIILAVTAATFLQCVTMPREEILFPSELVGTWRRVDQSLYTNTLTFTFDTLKDSSQNGHWKLVGVRGDAYTIAWHDNLSWRFTNTYKLVGNNLEIGGNNLGTGEDNWDGAWIKR